MQDDLGFPETETEGVERDSSGRETLYGLATSAMRYYIPIYLELTSKTKGFGDIKAEHVTTEDQRLIILSGINSPLNPHTTNGSQVVDEWQRFKAITFDIENAVTRGVYLQLREMTGNLLTELEAETNHFKEFRPEYITKNPRMLPILQRLANIPSKAALKKTIGSVSDNTISQSASLKLANLLNERSPGRAINRGQILQSIEPTLEGIVRDLVGRVLLEDIVANALDTEGIEYKREADYLRLKGVVYDFRADFVIPNEEAPKAFIEVRKSSSRHASLYAKDKMFSAINWKGQTKDLLAVLVVDGPWTMETLKIMTKVFDYVVPLSSTPEVARAISAYVNGDKTKLKWLIDFSINPAN
jgi:hypothetical protein